MFIFVRTCFMINCFIVMFAFWNIMSITFLIILCYVVGVIFSMAFLVIFGIAFLFVKSLYRSRAWSTLFESENERQKIEPVPIPLPRASRNFPDVKTRNEIFFHNWTSEIIPFIYFGMQIENTLWISVTIILLPFALGL